MDLDSSAVEIRTFDVARKGYDRMQVTDFLRKVAGSMSRLDERRKIAEVRAEQLERELREVRTRAEATIQETVAARARLIESSVGTSGGPKSEKQRPASVEMSNIEAQQIVQQANVHASAIQAEADAVLEGALSTSAKINEDRRELLGTVEAERAGLIAAATAEAEAIKAAARREGEKARAKGAGRAREIRSEAEEEAIRTIQRAEKRAAEIVVSAERRGSESAQERTIPSTPETPRSLKDRVADGDDFVDASLTDDEPDHVAVDLREEAPHPTPQRDPQGSRTSRYKSRSANLPRLGDDATSVIGSLNSLRGNKD